MCLRLSVCVCVLTRWGGSGPQVESQRTHAPPHTERCTQAAGSEPETHTHTSVSVPCFISESRLFTASWWWWLLWTLACGAINSCRIMLKLMCSMWFNFNMTCNLIWPLTFCHASKTFLCVWETAIWAKVKYLLFYIDKLSRVSQGVCVCVCVRCLCVTDFNFNV